MARLAGTRVSAPVSEPERVEHVQVLELVLASVPGPAPVLAHCSALDRVQERRVRNGE